FPRHTVGCPSPVTYFPRISTKAYTEADRGVYNANQSLAGKFIVHQITVTMPKSFKLGCRKEYVVASTSTVKITNDSNPPARRIMPNRSRIRSRSAPPGLVTVHCATLKPEVYSELLLELKIGSTNYMNPIRYLNPPELTPEVELCVMPEVSPVHGHLMDPESKQDTEPECPSMPELIPMTGIFPKLEHSAMPKLSSVTGVFPQAKASAENELRLNQTYHSDQPASGIMPMCFKIRSRSAPPSLVTVQNVTFQPEEEPEVILVPEMGSINDMNPVRYLNPPELIPELELCAMPELSLVHGHFMDPELRQEPIRMREHSSMTGIFLETELRQMPNLIPMSVLVPEIRLSAESEHRLKNNHSSQPAREIIPTCSRIRVRSAPPRLVTVRNLTFKSEEEPAEIQEPEMGSINDMNPIHNLNPPELITELRRCLMQEITERTQQESKPSPKPAMSDGPGQSQKDALTLKRGPNGKLQEDENSHSIGQDDIPGHVIALCAHAITLPLTHVINASISQGIFPSKLKTSKIILIHKKHSDQESK
ncbi:hypothetical protein J437_LFUL009279, partial [Ladona fulva]